MQRLVLILVLILPLWRVTAQHVPRSLMPEPKTTVIIFLATDCPISQKYIPRLNAIHQQYADDDVRFFSLIPGRVKKKEVSRFSSDFELSFEVSSDRKYRWTRALAAKVTPEVFVVDREGNVRYRGAIDNWFYELGGYRKEATENYLQDAINAVLAGNTPPVRETKALGCFIQTPSEK